MLVRAALLPVLAPLLLAPTAAVAAEAGAARPMASPTPVGVSAHGNCLTYASAGSGFNGGGSYGLRCAGSRRSASFGDLLRGAEPPTCWLRSPDDAGPTTTSARVPGTVVAPASLLLAAPGAAVEPPRTGAGPAPTPTTSAVPGPTADPTPEPAPTPTGEPAPTGGPTATAGPAATPEPGSTPVPTTPPPPPPPPPVELVQHCIEPPADPRTGIPSWGMRIVPRTVLVHLDSTDRYPLWTELTPGQQAYADLVHERSGRIKTSGVRTSPSTRPRVGQTVAFSRGSTENPAVVGTGDTRMRAVVVRLRVWPLPGAEPVTCEGGGAELAPGATRRTGAEVCSYTYRRTSSGRDFHGGGDTFRVTALETWRIEISEDAGATWQTYREVDLPTETGIQVTEVQTLVVPLPPSGGAGRTS
ncbi:hypothetical protein MN205_19870 [Kineococcus sp. TRM81007]|uniref:hypothetical protein n=1 Tax=Kineococcus sp. TRM81007 TaxID=2925831 RepID=UPI001F58EB36|nr:hypothetical protein [Kineococcus sp. TRM81007]MCI2240716.1 hypothetical protein [Kineococcus sp. TRM81007]